MNAAVHRYLANEAARRHGDVDARVIENLRRNIRRKFGPLVDRSDVQHTMEHYRAMYLDAAGLLGTFLEPQPRGTYADRSHVRVAEFVAALASRYPDESRATVQLIVDWCIFDEYLR